MTENVLAYLLETKGQAYVMNLLGLNKQQQNPKYAISLGGKSFDPMGMLKRAGVNKMFSSGSSMGGLGKAVPLLGAALGLGYLTNPLRPGSYNYNPNLQGQLDYAKSKGILNRNNSMNALQYGGDSVLSGQNAISGFGTNDYQEQLQEFIDKMQAKKTKGYNTLGGFKTTDFSKGQQEKLDKALAEKGELFETKQTTQEDYRTKLQGGDGGGTPDISKSDNQPGGFTSKDSARENYSRYAQGGIANL